MSNRIKLVSLDIDGTTYPEKGARMDIVDLAEMQGLVSQLKSINITPILCTGKIVGYVEAMAEVYGLTHDADKVDSPNVAENGAIIFNHRGNWSSREEILIPDVFRGSSSGLLVDKARRAVMSRLPNLKNEIGKIVSMSFNPPEGKTTEEMYLPVVAALRSSGFTVMTNDQTNAMNAHLNTLIGMLNSFTPIENIQSYVTGLSYDFFATYTPASIDITPFPTSKALGVAYVAHKKDIALEAVIAFGDSSGDHPVFALPGVTPFAMGNSSKETKDFAIEHGGFVTTEGSPYGVHGCLKILYSVGGKKEKFFRKVVERGYAHR